MVGILLIGEYTLSALMQTVKGESSEWININGFTSGKFQWQQGYGAFSYTRNLIGRVYKYIMNQKEHHKKQTFSAEYLTFLKNFHVEFDERYLFKAVE